MRTVTAILGALFISLTASAGPVDIQIFETLTKVGIKTDLSPWDKAKILSAAIQCRNIQESYECYLNDSSNYGFQLTIIENEGKLVYDLLSSVLHTPPFYETTDSNKSLSVQIWCAQSNKDGLTACHAKLGRADKPDLNWGNPLNFEKLATEK